MNIGKLLEKEIRNENAEIAFGVIVFVLLLGVGLALYFRLKRKQT